MPEATPAGREAAGRAAIVPEATLAELELDDEEEGDEDDERSSSAQSNGLRVLEHV